MPTEYDARRPRLPVELAERIDASRGQVPFNRFVVEALEQKVDGSLEPRVLVPGALEETLGEPHRASSTEGGGTSGENPAAGGVPGASGKSAPASPRAPYRKPFNPRPKGKS